MNGQQGTSIQTKRPKCHRGLGDMLQATEIKHLQIGDEEITIADRLADSFSEISSTTDYTTKFQSHKTHTEDQPLK